MYIHTRVLKIWVHIYFDDNIVITAMESCVFVLFELFRRLQWYTLWFPLLCVTTAQGSKKRSNIVALWLIMFEN